MNNLQGLLLDVVFLLAGVVLCVGASHKWDWLVNPSDRMWPYYSQAVIKRLFGRRFTIGFTYFLGVLFIAAALFGLMNDIQRLRP